MKRLAVLLLSLLLPIAALAQAPGIGLDALPTASGLGGGELIFMYQPGSGGSGAAICARGWCPVSATPLQVATYITGLGRFTTITGAITTGHCVEWASATSLEDAGAACGAGGGGGITQLTGDVAAGPGSGAVSSTVVQVNGATIPASQSALASNSSHQLIAATIVPFFNGSFTINDCVNVEATSPVTFADAGMPCGTGGGGAFSSLTGGTNTTAAMLVGSGASIGRSGSGTIDASTLLGLTFAAPGPIGSITPSSAIFSTLTVAGGGQFVLANTLGSTQCLSANSSGTVTGTGSPCSSGSGTVASGVGGDLAYYATSGTTVSQLPLGTGFGISSGTLVPVQVINAQTGTAYTVLSSDGGKLVTLNNSSPVAVTLPQATGSFGAGFSFDVQNTGVGTVTITPATSSINGVSTLVVTSNQGCSITSDGANYQLSACSATATAPAFGALTGGTNTTAAMLVGSGASLGVTGAGTINATTLGGNTFAAPAAIGGGTAAAGNFTTLGATGNITTNVTGSTQCLQVNTSGVVSGTGAGCGGSTNTAAFPGWSSASQAQANTAFYAPGGLGALGPATGTLQHLYFAATNAPAGGQTYTITIYAGTPGSTSATAVTCTVSNPNKTCNDTTNTGAITAGNEWQVQVVTSATSGSTGNMQFGFEYTSP